MLDGMRLYVKSIVVVAIGLSSMLSFASSAAMTSQTEATGKAVSVAQQGIEGQSQTLLPDGRLLVAGGQTVGIAVKTAFFQDAKTGAQTETSGTLISARSFHSATLLPNGSVLIFGGIGDGDSVLAQAELFDPVKQEFVDIATAGLTPRAHHSATLLTDGRVLIAGGLDSQGNTLSQIEVWDYRTGQSATLAAGLRTPRSGHTAALLSDGTVLLWGGEDDHGSSLKDGEVIDPNGPSVRIVNSLTSSIPYSDLPRLAASIPQSGETGIPVNQVISLRFSEPLSVTSLNVNTITLRTSTGKVAIQVVPAEGGLLTFITPQDSLQNSTAYTLSISGTTDSAGRVLPDTVILFTTVAALESGITAGGSGSTNTGSAGATGVGAGATPSGLTSEWRKLPVLQADDGVTALAGQVLTLDGSPLPNVLIEIDNQRATTDKTGRFLIHHTGSGHHMMIVDGAPANTQTNSYGLYRIGVDLKAGITNSLNYTVWMTALDTEHVVDIASPSTSEVIVTNPNVPGLELHIPAGTVIHDARGKVVTQVGITPIPMNQPPFPLKVGVQFPVYFTIQPGGATFTNAGKVWTPAVNNGAKGAKIYYKNYLNGKPGARYSFWNYDPAQKGWYVYGHGRVSKDSKTIAPEDGTQIWSFDGAMVSQPSNAPPKGSKPWYCIIPFLCSDSGDPVDLQTGLFNYTKTDLALNDVIPLVLTRSYRQGDSLSRAFGIGTNINYNIFMVGDDLFTPEGYTWQDLILADGGRVHFTRTSPCTGANGYCDYSNAVYTATSTPGGFYGASLVWVNGYWTMTKKDGTVYQFPDSSNANDPQQAAPLGMHDRYGNSLTFTRDGYGNLIRVTSPNGRWIQLTYDPSNRITGAQDNIGRSTSYTYNSTGYLESATDVSGGVTKYTYDSNGNMTNITDPNNVMYLQNAYDANDMVSVQTLADGGTFQFTYSLDSNGNVTQSTVKDSRGYIRTATFNSDGYMTSNTSAVGMPEQQTVTATVQQGTGLVLSSTDALNRTTTYSYDSMANMASVTRLAGTANAATTTFTYNPKFSQLLSTTDPLGNTTALTYDSNGNMLSATDPLGNATRFSYNASGQPITATDALGNMTQFGYSAGSLISITNPLGRTTSRFVDAAGRVVTVTDPLGSQTTTAYDPRNEITSTVDPLGNKTSFAYDGDGNLLSVTDANNHTTSYKYNGMDQMVTRTDPLNNFASIQYDHNGNISQVTDRKGQITTYTYDGLNRMVSATFADSTVTNTYDAGNRLTSINDSLTGTITRTYDGFDHLLSEATPQGSLSYTYDGDERRQTMAVTGQAQVSYSYDNASRLNTIIQGGSVVSFGYDSNGRRTSMKLPNGVTASYSYDAASQLTGINYQGPNLAPQNLAYTYDLAGRRIGVSGGLASTQLPAAVSNAAYNANNQLTQWGSTAITYDKNGNTLNDGTNSYSWDARNRLASANSNADMFAYDPLGRRVKKTILSTTTNFLYDGANAVQESGTLPTANLLTGGVDERFQRTSSTETDDYLTDALGSTIELTGPTGATQVQYSYGPYGSQSASGATTTNSYAYTGREFDGLGIDYYRARYYNPSTGRFLSEDPLGLVEGPNLYAYANGSPVVFTDPSGKDFISGAITGAIFGALGGMDSGAAGMIGGAIGGAAAGAAAGFFLPPGPLTGAAAGAAGDLAGQAIGGGNINWGEVGGSALGGAVGGGFSQYMNSLGAASGLAGPTLDWGTDIFGGGVGMVGGMLGGKLGGGEGGNGSGGNGSGGNGSGGNGGGGNGGGGCSMAAKKC